MDEVEFKLGKEKEPTCLAGVEAMSFFPVLEVAMVSPDSYDVRGSKEEMFPVLEASDYGQ